MSLASFVVAASATLASARLPSLLETRDFTGPACNPTFQWMNNAKTISPCQLAAVVLGTCSTSWNVPPLKNGNVYDPPSPVENTVNQCSCSWAAYNLLSACTVCQGFAQNIVNWSFYKTNCTSNQLSSTFFPSSQTLPNDTAIPFYAVTDPDKWNDKKFNVEQAMAFHDKGRQDETQSSSHKSSNSAGPIAGGVVGALAVILLGGGLAFFLYRKKQKWSKAAVGHVMDEGPGHARTVSDLSQKSNGIGYGYRQMERSFATSPSSQVPMSPTSGTMHTHNSSVNSLSYFGSVNHSVAPYAVASSPPPRGPSPLSTTSPTPVSHVGLNREDIIVPFTLPPSDEGVSGQGSHTNLVGGDRKRADGAIIPVYDSPNSLPSHIAQASSARNDSPSRARVNPPAYSAVDQQSVAPSRPHQMHSKKGSADTQYSVDSAASGGVTSVMPRHTSGGSISAIDDVIGQMGFGQGEESVSGSGGTLGTGQSRQFIRTQPFRPVLGNPDP